MVLKRSVYRRVAFIKLGQEKKWREEQADIHAVEIQMKITLDLHGKNLKRQCSLHSGIFSLMRYQFGCNSCHVMTRCL